MLSIDSADHLAHRGLDVIDSRRRGDHSHSPSGHGCALIWPHSTLVDHIEAAMREVIPPEQIDSMSTTSACRSQASNLTSVTPAPLAQRCLTFSSP